MKHLRWLWVMCAAACPLVIFSSVRLARADWLRRTADAARIDDAIRLDPMNAYAYTIKAELAEQDGREADAEREWRWAIKRNRHDAEARIRLALLEERRGAPRDSERDLLEAARVNHMWLPRWTLVNFYIRHGRNDEARRWAVRAFERASADVAGLFGALDDAGIGIDDLLPANRQVLAAYVAFRSQRGPVAGVERVATGLASLIPDRPAEWPGLDERGTGDACTEYERSVVFGAIDKLLDAGDARAAVGMWNVFESRGAFAGERWKEQSPVINSRFAVAPFNGGFDWRVNRIDGIEVQAVPEAGELDVQLSGRQPEIVDVISERVFVPAGRSYELAVESRTEGLNVNSGLEWQIRDATGTSVATVAIQPTDDWKRRATAVGTAAEDRVMRVMLTCRRVIGAVRAEGTARFRLAALEASR